jgi:hypothetical protein
MRAITPSPFELFPVEQLYPEEKARRNTADDDASSSTQPKSAIQSMSGAYRPLSEKSGLAILTQACLLTNGNVVFGPANASLQSKPRATAKKSYHKDTFYMEVPEARDARTTRGSLEMIEEEGKKMLNIICVSSNIKHIDLDFLVRHGFELAHLIERCEVPIEELRLAKILVSFDDLLALGFKLHDLVLNHRLFNTDKLVALYDVMYEDLRACKRFSFTAFDLVACQFYPSELKQLEFSFEPMISRRYIDKKQLAALRFALDDMSLLGFTAQHADQLDITARDARKLFRWDEAEFDQFCQPAKMKNRRY